MLRQQQRKLRDYIAEAAQEPAAADEPMAVEEDVDDEYRQANPEPRVILTTSIRATDPCIRFAKELCLTIPNCNRVNRGKMNESEIVEMARAMDCTDIIEVSGSNGEGRPTLLKLSHLPFGPTIHFTIGDLLLRSDLDERPPKMKQETPHLVFHNFENPVGRRVMRALQHVFPLEPTESKRVISFVNLESDVIHVRHHLITHRPPPHEHAKPEQVELEEQGPRFTLEPFKIVRGVVGDKFPDVEWEKSYFIRKAARVI